MDDSLHAGVKRSSRAYEKGVLGIVSTLPGQVLSDGSDAGHPVLVALTGRVPAKVSTENGPIRVGDYLTSSSIPGVAMKATKAGPAVGKAMTAYDGEDIGSVLVFVNSSWFSGEISELMPEGLYLDGAEAPTGDNYSDLLLGRLSSQITKTPAIDLSNIFADRLVAGLEIIAPKVIADELRIGKITARSQSALLEIQDGGEFVVRNQSGEEIASFSESGATIKGAVRTDIVDSTQTISAEIGQRYYANDSSITTGDVVMLDPAAIGKVKKADVPHASTLIGIVTSAPAILVDSEGSGSSVIIAAAGRVSVKVSTENGAIKAGDALTSSTTSGIAMRATGNGSIIGRATMGYSGEGVGSIVALVGNGVSTTDFTADINSLTTRLTDLEGQVSGMQTTDSTTGAITTGGQEIDLSNLTVGQLTVELDLIVQGAMVVDGPATFRQAARFQRDVTIDGDLAVKGTATLNRDAAGLAKIATGERSIFVTFSKPYAALPVITVSLGDGKFATYSYRNVTPNGFEIILKDAATEDLTFSWTATSVSNQQTFLNAPSSP